MSVTYVLIATVTVSTSTAASMEFTNISSSYDDLHLVISARSARAVENRDDVFITFNGSTANYSNRVIRGSGSAVTSQTGSTASSFSRMDTTAAGATASTFGSHSIYIPNYRGSTNKSVSIDATMENNATESFSYLNAGLWSDTAAITSISLKPEVSSWVQHSSAYLYGIKKS